MAGAELSRLSWRMQGIRKKQQAVNQLTIFRNKNRSLPPAVGMATQKYRSMFSLFHQRNRSSQTVTVSGRAAGRGWPEGAIGAEWQIEPQDCETGGGKSIGHLDQQFRLAVCAGAVCQDNCIAARR